MKKLFTLALLSIIAVGINAQNYRKWDFTNWSAQTIANLTEEATKGVTGGTWSDTEKADGTNPQVGKCYWSYGDNIDENGYLMANGTVIAETEGLVFNTTYTAKRSLAIAVDYPSTSLGTYAGPQYLWLGGGNAKSAGARILCFTIPKVKIGQKITVVAESHNPSQARGISLFVNAVTNDANQIGVSFKPTTQDTYTWQDWTLPDGVTVDGDVVDILVYNTNGCHIYSIEVGDASESSKVAYLYNGSIDSELAYAQLNTESKFVITPIEATAAFTIDQLTAFDAIVISSTVSNADAIASLKDIFPFVPTLNLNPALYAAWGYGAAGTDEHQFAVLTNHNSSLFKGLEIINEEGSDIYGLPLVNSTAVTGVTLGNYFANDDILGTIMDSEDVAIHAHNASHNGYMFVPYTNEALADAANAALLNNAVNQLIGSKSKVSAAPKPSFTLDYKDMSTTVSIKSGVPMAQIFYTTDGSEPTEASTLYTEPFTITAEGITVKAVAKGDGYLLSEVAEQAIAIKQQAVAPTINVTQADGKTTVTITGEGTIWYNYSNVSDTQKSIQYTEPFVLSYPRTIYAFTTEEGKVNSELVSEEVKDVEGYKPRLNVLAHMDANSTDYGGSTSPAYYFTWGKNKNGENGYNYFNPNIYSTETGQDPETGDEISTKIYTELNPEEEKDFGNGWMLRSRGQIVDWENLNTGENYGDTGGYNFATIDDNNPNFPATKGAIVLADKNTIPSDGQSFPYNAYIVTTQKFKGPFDVVINVGSITKLDAGAKHQLVLETSTKGYVWDSSWETIGDTINFAGARLTQNIIRSYNGGDEVYVRAYLCGNNSKAGFYDIYIANDPEEIATGISTLANRSGQAGTVIFSINGVQQQGLRRGVNIVKSADGTVRKVAVK